MSTVRAWKGKDSLEPLLVAISDLHNHPSNPRRGDVDRLAESLDRFGQYRPLVATTGGTILAGNHTYRAAVKLGWTHVAATMDTYSQEDQEALLVSDNRHSDLSTNDDPILLAHLRRLDAMDALGGTGFAEGDLAELEAALAGVPIPDLDLPALDLQGGEPDEDPGDSDDGEERGSKLAIVDVTIDEPKTILARGSKVKLGPHVLLVESVYTGWPRWVHELVGDALFVPYPTPTVPLAERAQRHKLILVQPDPYLAGHLVDKYVSVYGAENVEVTDG